jgi:hypothetical protein
MLALPALVTRASAQSDAPVSVLMLRSAGDERLANALRAELVSYRYHVLEITPRPADRSQGLPAMAKKYEVEAAVRVDAGKGAVELWVEHRGSAEPDSDELVVGPNLRPELLAVRVTETMRARGLRVPVPPAERSQPSAAVNAALAAAAETVSAGAAATAGVASSAAASKAESASAARQTGEPGAQRTAAARQTGEPGAQRTAADTRQTGEPGAQRTAADARQTGEPGAQRTGADGRQTGESGARRTAGEAAKPAGARQTGESAASAARGAAQTAGARQTGDSAASAARGAAQTAAAPQTGEPGAARAAAGPTRARAQAPAKPRAARLPPSAAAAADETNQHPPPSAAERPATEHDTHATSARVDAGAPAEARSSTRRWAPQACSTRARTRSGPRSISGSIYDCSRIAPHRYRYSCSRRCCKRRSKPRAGPAA